MPAIIKKQNNNKSDLRKIITQSFLENSDKELWYRILQTTNDKDIDPILELLHEDQSHLDFLTENLVSKMEILRKGDNSAWGELIENEKEYLEKM